MSESCHCQYAWEGRRHSSGAVCREVKGAGRVRLAVWWRTREGVAQQAEEEGYTSAHM